jgi:hypothetical protein
MLVSGTFYVPKAEARESRRVGSQQDRACELRD